MNIALLLIIVTISVVVIVIIVVFIIVEEKQAPYNSDLTFIEQEPFKRFFEWKRGNE